MIRITKGNATGDKQYYGLLEDLNKTETDLANAYSNLEYMVDPDLIDYYIYQVKAVQMRHKFLLSKVKQLESSYASAGDTRVSSYASAGDTRVSSYAPAGDTHVSSYTTTEDSYARNPLEVSKS